MMDIDINDLTIGTEFTYRCKNNSFQPISGAILDFVRGKYRISYTVYVGTGLQQRDTFVTKDFFLNTGHYQSIITELVNKKQPNFIVDSQFKELYI